MKKTTVKYIGGESFYWLLHISRYRCLSCKASFLDTDANYQYCPYCGRKIKKTVN